MTSFACAIFHDLFHLLFLFLSLLGLSLCGMVSVWRM